ncbi:hypothetical protein ES703_113531 [subsurface metagenome]
MELRVSYSLFDNVENEIESGKAQIRLDKENLSILPEFNNTIFSPLREIIKFEAREYKIFLSLLAGDKIVLSKLGYKFEDFLRVFSKMKNELLLKDMLMYESLKKSGVKAELIHLNEKGDEQQKDECELRLYETAIVIIPEKNEITRIPFCDISNVRGEDYRIVLTVESGGTIIISSRI